jgi:uncharacterized Zn finger protein
MTTPQAPDIMDEVLGRVSKAFDAQHQPSKTDLQGRLRQARRAAQQAEAVASEPKPKQKLGEWLDSLTPDQLEKLHTAASERVFSSTYSEGEDSMGDVAELESDDELGAYFDQLGAVAAEAEAADSFEELHRSDEEEGEE